jgi:hypothetical protein
VRSLSGTLASAVFALLAAAPAAQVEVLRSVGGLPAHIAGRFVDLTDCQQSPDGTFFVFDRRSHIVYSAEASADAPREIVQIGAEPGKILRPYAFDFASDGTFVVADAPQGRARVQIFFSTGGRIGGFSIPGREVSLVVLDNLVVSGLGSLVYTGRSILMSRPETGSLITELGVDGVSARSFGELRTTGHEQERDLHLALNSGLVVVNPKGGFYFVFAAGVPLFRKYDASGKFLFERHVEGVELDDYMRSRPTAWPRRKTTDGEIPIVRPVVRAADADASGNLWVSLDVPYTYVYDERGDKARVVQFRAAGIVAPTNMSFTANGRLLVTPGCFLFDVRSTSRQPPDRP